MGDDDVTPRPGGPAEPALAGLRHWLRRAKVARAAVVLTVLVVGTVWPLTGIGLPFVDVPDLDVPSFGFVRDVDPPGWADGFLDVLKPVKNGVVALLVLLAAFGEYERRRKKPGSDEPPAARPPHDTDPPHDKSDDDRSGGDQSGRDHDGRGDRIP